MYRNLLHKNYNAKPYDISLQASTYSVDFRMLKLRTPDQYCGLRRGLKFNSDIY